jgi:hypothetical protein
VEGIERGATTELDETDAFPVKKLEAFLSGKDVKLSVPSEIALSSSSVATSGVSGVQHSLLGTR